MTVTNTSRLKATRFASRGSHAAALPSVGAEAVLPVAPLSSQALAWAKLRGREGRHRLE